MAWGLRVQISKRITQRVGFGLAALGILAAFQNCGTGFEGVNSAGLAQSSVSMSPSAPTVPAVPTAPIAPDLLVATGVSNSEVDLSWKDNSTGLSAATQYTLSRAMLTGSTIGAYQVIAILPAGTLTYKDTNLTAASSYFYELTSSNNIGTSPSTTAVLATTQK